ncbi:hypothetical protein [Peribacillus muralis]|uniref:hypothetical protein n=1 Tax=Peribacillus muralis TaxID=264697 RepID=UPI0007111D5B|nr:hypothetical protein [Peribacillus muralis]
MNNDYQQYVNKIMNSWEKEQKEGAIKIIKKYGHPQEAIPSRLIWYNNGPWKRTTLYRDSVPHNFPANHEDFLEQTVDYRTPIDVFEKIARFDGSCYPDRTKGEVSVICDTEEANFLFVNLFHDIVTGKRTEEEAKFFAAKTEEDYLFNNISSPYLEKILFPPQRFTNDPGIQYFDKKT